MHDSGFPQLRLQGKSSELYRRRSEQANNAASKDSDANIREPFITIVRVDLAGKPQVCAKYQA
jgi:hypothetical protein